MQAIYSPAEASAVRARLHAIALEQDWKPFPARPGSARRVYLDAECNEMAEMEPLASGELLVIERVPDDLLVDLHEVAGRADDPYAGQDWPGAVVAHA